MDTNEEDEIVNATFRGLQEFIKSNKALMINENKKVQIENLSKQYELKKELKLTFCIICDNLDRKSTLIDALLKNKVSDYLRSDRQYLVKSDPSIQETIIGDEKQKLCTITVENSRLNLLNDSNIVLSFEKYSQFIENIQITNCYKPDVIVLVVNSPKDLEKDHIQSFFDSIKGQFNDENFIFVLNEGEALDCTATNICDVCYPSHIRDLFRGHKLENREFKISSSRVVNAQSDNSSYLDKNYQDLLDALQNELNINRVMNRYKQQADNIRKDIDTIIQNFNDINFETSMNEYNNRLTDKTENILEKLKDHKSNSIKGMYKMFENNHKSNADKKSQMKKYLIKNCNRLNENIQKDLLNLLEETNLKDCNNIIRSVSINLMKHCGLNKENMTKKLYELFDEYLEKQFPENVVKKNIEEPINNESIGEEYLKNTDEENIEEQINNESFDEKYLQKTDEENIEEQINNESFGEKYLQKTDEEQKDEQRNNEGFITAGTNVLNRIFEYVKTGFIAFTNVFKSKCISIADETREEKMRIKFIEELKKFKINLKNEMIQETENLFQSLGNIIYKHKSTDLSNDNNLNTDIFSTVTKETINMSGTIKKIKFFLVQFGKFSNKKCEDFIKNYFPMIDFENFHKTCESKLIELIEKIQDDTFCKIEQKIQKNLKTVLWLFVVPFKEKVIEIKVIRYSEVQRELEIMKKDVLLEMNNIINKISMSLDNSVNIV